MMGRIWTLIQQLVADPGSVKDLSLRIRNENILQQYIDDPYFPFFISFPRTGSHWLRLLMELYFERPSLVRIFYFKDSRDFLSLHTHDEDLDVSDRKNVLYLYRDPVSTIYSQLKFYNEDTNDIECLEKWAALYGQHLSKWLVEEEWTEKKTILRYENMTKNLESEFAKVTAHFGQELNPKKLQEVAAQVSKAEVKKKTAHDQRVINYSNNYADSREVFAEKHGEKVMNFVFEQNAQLQQYF
ncbi:MAG: sulfotransferase domain-containing protein [Jaaginema sp. PMC 1079.18]|nr:sulfotransferase domain-containing protein [Jaaginema sp. PMC 1080.18]MEC4852544.1 sulfotransferase domain-containing protein [Jaaginema sp. PMC 1079.18]MEC4864587.1 sulfotransferase domain-containing protein [Jaaginema sp. PMC 1078.18]